MTPESEAIPYEPARLRGERLLVLAPHPDDEAIGCGGLVAQHLREKRAVRVVIATDGAQGGDGITRESESRSGLALLGGTDDVVFLRFPDRALDENAIADRLREQLAEFRPDLILVPSPVEIHPDHLALARAFCTLVQRDESLFADLAVTQVAFYEVGQPIRPNAIVDINDVAAMKYAAIAAHQSQLAVRDYVAYARGLNAYRAMTLPKEVRFAEGYFVVPLPKLREIPFSELRRMIGAPPELAVSAEPLPVSVIIRTKDRPALLREAIDSVRATGYPCEIVVVNDGGAVPEVDNVTLVNHETSRGRSEAANAGVRAAGNAFIAFLDDDDLYYPEHLEVLTNAARGSQHAAWYSDAVSAFASIGDSGTLETHSRLRIFSSDFDRELLLVDNYIPLPTLLMPRQSFLDAGGFDPKFDLFEDWDFLIRLSRRGDFVHVPRVTCEIRHVEGAGSIVMSQPEGSPKFREAKLRVWSKHAELLTNDVFATAFERQKRRAGKAAEALVEEKGLRQHVETNGARLEREKGELLAQLQSTSGELNGALLRSRELEGAVAVLQGELAQSRHAIAEAAELRLALDGTRAVLTDAQNTLSATTNEVARLQGLLDMIYRSRTWKLHTMVEKMKGRG